MKILGTGGIPDVITYLEKRRNIHRKLEKLNRTQIETISMEIKAENIIENSLIADSI